MKRHVPGAVVSVGFTLPLNEDGSKPTLTALRWRVLDSLNNELWGSWSDVASTDPEFAQAQKSGTFNVTLDQAITSIGTDAYQEARTVELSVEADTVVRVLTEIVLLQRTSVLLRGVNSFCTYAQAMLASNEIPVNNLSGWISEPEQIERERALVSAYGSFMNMPIFVQGYQLRTFIDEFGVAELEKLTGADSKLLPVLIKAQVIEASETITADPTLVARRNGLLSMTVGESSQFFGGAKPIETAALSRQVYSMLSPWIRYTTRIGRG